MTVSPPAGLSVSRLAIRRHIGTLMLTLAVIVLGFFFITRLPVDLLPSITYPRIGLRLDAPGISPEVAVDEVTRPLEQALSATEGVEQVFSQTREGRISIDLFFRPGGDIDQALNDATATLNRARDTLPDTVGEPRLFKFDPSQLPVYELALTSETLQGVDLRVFAEEELARELGVIPGVASVDVSGGVAEEVQINLNLSRLQAFGLDLTDVLDALEARNQDTAGGRLRGGEAESLTRLRGKFQTADEVRNLIFTVGDRTPLQQVYLRDFAEVIDGTEEPRIFVMLNGQPAVKVSIQKQPDANTVAVVEDVKQRLETLQASGLVPADMALTPTLDESRFIRNAIGNVAISGLTGSALAAIAVLLFLGSLRQTLIIVLAIPLATLTAILLIKLFGLSLNVFSLGGLALGVGIVVDNSIVMLENIAQGVENSSEPSANGAGNGHKGSRRSVIQQAEQSSQELESALLASTTTNLVAVLPFLLIGGFISLLFNELILTVSFAVASSLVVGLTVVPALAARLLAIRGSSGLRRFWLIRQFSQKLEAATGRYIRFLRWLLQRRVAAIALAFLVLGGGSLLMVGQVPQEILPQIDTGQARLFAQLPPGTALSDNRQVMQAIDELLLAQPETEYTFTTAGGALFASITSENALRGSSTITLKPGADVAAFVERMSQEFEQFNLVDTLIRISPESVRGLVLSNSPVRSEIDIGLQGSNTEALRQAGRQVLAALGEQATLARYRPDADDAQPEVQIRPDWERAADLGLTAEDLGDTVQTILNGSVPTQLQRGDRLVDIRVQVNPGQIQRPAQLRQIPLFTDQGQLVQLGDVAQIEAGQAPGEIQRINQRQVFLIAGSLAEGASLGEALDEAALVLAGLELPEGVSILPSSSAETNQQLQASLVVLGGLAAFLVFVVMAVQYNSLIDPLVIMLTVPLALAGGILGLFITQTAIGATVIVGAVLLVGIVVNNAIIMVELANQLRDRAAQAFAPIDPQTAILQAAPQRLRPILMTTITTVLGLFPLALGIGEGSEFLQPLGVVVFSGLSLATVLTLLIIPCFYSLLHDPRWSGWGRRLTRKTQTLVISQRDR
ncbi:MAG: efflux RND transporter permease subunit [Leptolyngbyaceae cyanobacterium SL_1_1]|nr:efflux RND transporter permease subunit [Leptolyngbyaceae cyanobacterium RM1_1_2]NJO08849.1 efflux RND transporter permease subunit [Leptolyngbyaceae cyanobacterium SL_1_1]